jgi:hypothetical protein
MTVTRPTRYVAKRVVFVWQMTFLWRHLVVHSWCTVVSEYRRGCPNIVLLVRPKLLNPNSRPQDGLVC